MENIELSGKFTACVFFVLLFYSFFPIFIISIFSFDKKIAEGFIVVWYLLGAMIFIEFGLPLIANEVIKKLKDTRGAKDVG